MFKHQVNETLNDSLDDKTLRIVLLGDRKVGKSKLLLEYVKNNQCDPLSPSISNVASGNDYIPTTMEIFRADFQVEHEKYSLMILDLSGNQSESVYINLRSHLYGQFCNVDVILLCFSLVDQISFADLNTKWMPEIRQNFKEVPPIILVGTKADLKQSIKSMKSSKSLMKQRKQLIDEQQQQKMVKKPSLLKQESAGAASYTSTNTTSTASTLVPSPPSSMASPASSVLSSPQRLLGGEILKAGAAVAASIIFTPPTTPVLTQTADDITPNTSMHSRYSISNVSRMTKDEFIASLNNTNKSHVDNNTAEEKTSYDVGDDDVFEEKSHHTELTVTADMDAFRRCLDQADKLVRDTNKMITVNEFLADTNNMATMQDQLENFSHETTIEEDRTFEESTKETTLETTIATDFNEAFLSTTLSDDMTTTTSSSSSGLKSYINERRAIKMKSTVGAVDYFKTSIDDPKSINELMEKALAVGVAYHMKRVKAAREKLERQKKLTKQKTETATETKTVAKPTLATVSETHVMTTAKAEFEGRVTQIIEENMVSSVEVSTTTLSRERSLSPRPHVPMQDKQCQTSTLDELFNEMMVNRDKAKSSRPSFVRRCFSCSRSDTTSSISTTINK